MMVRLMISHDLFISLIVRLYLRFVFFFFFQAEDGIRDYKVTGVQTCALPICHERGRAFRVLLSVPAARTRGEGDRRGTPRRGARARREPQARRPSFVHTDRKSVV